MRGSRLGLLLAATLASAVGCSRSRAALRTCGSVTPADVAGVVGGTGAPTLSYHRAVCTWTAPHGHAFYAMQFDTGRVPADLMYEMLRRRQPTTAEPSISDTACSYWSSRLFNVLVFTHRQIVVFAVRKDGDALSQDSVAYTQRLRDAMRPVIKEATASLGVSTQ